MASFFVSYADGAEYQQRQQLQAAAVQELDLNSGLQKYYGKSLPSPQETVFNAKTAMGRSIDLAGKSVPLAALLKHDPNTFGDILGDDIVGEISDEGSISEGKLVEILPTLPRDMQELLARKLGL